MTPRALIQADETLEALTDELQILQKRRGFRFGVEPILLAAFAQIEPQAKVADFGTGTGVLPLLLYSRGKGAAFDAIELAAPMAEMASRTMQFNGLDHCIHILHGDVCTADQWLMPGTYDAVVCNPPYRRGTPSADPLRAMAMSLPRDGLLAWYQAAKKLLKPAGKLHLVIPPELLQQTEHELKRSGFCIRRQCRVFHSAEKPAMLVLLTAGREPAAEFEQETLILYEADGTMTRTAKAIYRLTDETTEKV